MLANSTLSKLLNKKLIIHLFNCFNKGLCPSSPCRKALVYEHFLKIKVPTDLSNNQETKKIDICPNVNVLKMMLQDSKL
jgi:hypothetical protein